MVGLTHWGHEVVTNPQSIPLFKKWELHSISRGRRMPTHAITIINDCSTCVLVTIIIVLAFNFFGTSPVMENFFIQHFEYSLAVFIREWLPKSSRKVGWKICGWTEGRDGGRKCIRRWEVQPLLWAHQFEVGPVLDYRMLLHVIQVVCRCMDLVWVQVSE